MDSIRSHFDRLRVNETEKNNAESTCYRELGNREYAKGTMQSCIASLSLYNKAICFAEPNSEALSIVYANRSAVYFSMKLYDECLKSIELAYTQSGFPQRLQPKLTERWAKALAGIAEQADNADHCGPNEPKLTKPANPKIPFIANCLQLKKNAQYGRHVVTTDDLKVGDVIAIDTPFCIALGEGLLYERCDNCWMEAARNLIPCNGCTNVMFCNEECCEDAIKRYHGLECSVMKHVRCDLTLLSATDRLAIRLTFTALSEFESLDELFAFATEVDRGDYNIFTMDFSGRNVGSKERYGPVHTLKMADETPLSRRVVDGLQKSVCTAIMNQVEGSSFDEKRFEHLLKIMHCHAHVVLLNSHQLHDVGALYELRQAASNKKSRTTGIYPIVSMMNHACVPNVLQSVFGNKMVITVSRPIKAGHQVFDNYGFSHIAYPINERRRALSFRCECIACQENYPTAEMLLKDLPITPIRRLISDCTVQLIQGDFEKTRTMEPSVIKYLQDHDHEYPKGEVIIFSEFYRHIRENLYCKEIPLVIRFNSV